MSQTRRPNILFIMADDVGWFNISCNNNGVLGYRTPNIDRIAKEGANFTDFYGQQSGTAGRAAFLTGQAPIRTGLTRVGLPGAKFGISHEDPTIAEFLKSFGYATGQFGKNCFGDRNEHLPTVHGFDEFFGTLYHFGVDEPEDGDSKKVEARKRFGPRGVLKLTACEDDDPTEDPVFGRVGRQVIEDTGSLTRRRMLSMDAETLAAAGDFLERKTAAGVPWFCFVNTTCMHVWTHLKRESDCAPGLGLYATGIVELDGFVGKLLAKLDALQAARDTVVVFTSDNGAELLASPPLSHAPVPGENDAPWEGGWRIPCVMRWNGVLEPGRMIKDICSLLDFIPTFAAANGEPDLVGKVKRGYMLGHKRVKVHLDGYNLLPLLKGEAPSPRDGFLYWNDEGELLAMRLHDYKIHFADKRTTGVSTWRQPFARVHLPKYVRLRSDPFDRGDETRAYRRSDRDHSWLIDQAQGVVTDWLESFKEFPPRAGATGFGEERAAGETAPNN